MRRVLVLLIVAACSSSGDDSSARVTGDSCALYPSADTCNADTDCTWLGTGCACPSDDPSCTCGDGSCASKTGDGSGDGSGTTGAACACPGDGVCYEQVGGPATSTPPTIDCATPAAGSGDPCARIQGQGTCEASPSVSGLCLCDNGIR